MENSGILLVVSEPAHRAIVASILTAHGEEFQVAECLDAAFDALRSRHRDLVVADLAMIDDPRAAAERLGGVPVLILCDEQHQAACADVIVNTPFRCDDLVATVRRLLGVDRMRAVSGEQAERLAKLLGAEPAAAMLGRFFDGLEAGIGQVEAGGDAGAIGHKLGGMAGLVGYGVLAAAWLSLEDHGMAAWPTVRALSLEAIARHRAEFSPADGDDRGA